MTTPVTPVAAVDVVLAHEVALQIDVSANATPQWQSVRFTSAINPQVTPTLQDATTYDDEGTQRQERTGETWTVGFNVLRYRDGDGNYLPEHEVLRKAGDPGKRGDATKVHVRWYDKKGADEAYEGNATVTWARGNTDSTGLGTATVTLAGQGILTPIANPIAED